MRPQPNPSRRASQPDVYERLTQRLEATAERDGHYSNAEKIRLLRAAYFADVDALVASGRVKLPPMNTVRHLTPALSPVGAERGLTP